MVEGYLNVGLRFERLDSRDKRSFLGMPQQESLSGGTSLYRFVWFARAKKALNSDDVLSPFWILQETYHEFCRLHDVTDVPMRELVRGIGAIAFDFTDPISGLLKARLRRGSHCLKGTIALQPMLGQGNRELQGGRNPELRKVVAPGGLEQVYIPNLTWKSLFDVQLSLLSQSGRSTFLYLT